MSNIIDLLKNNKRFQYIAILSVIALFCIVLNITFSAFTRTTNKNAANIKVENLSYSTAIDGNTTSIIEATNNKITKKNIFLIANNTLDTKYELTYEVCTDSTCSETTSKPENFKVEYSSKTIDSVKDTIGKTSTKIIRLIITNDTDTTYYIKLGVNAGFTHNSLVYKNQIVDEYSENDLTVISYINGVKNNNFPTSEDYTPFITCNNGASGYAFYDGVQWLLTVNDLTETETKCEIDFVTGAPDNYWSSSNGTLLAGIRNNNTISRTPLTTPGQAISLETEAILAPTVDDYGTSYYYRGDVDNNFVSFAGMCWRIVRIVGDGSIKLTLYNYNPTSASNPCAASLDGDTNAFARLTAGDANSYKSAFNTNYNKNAYIGYMYGTPGSSTYEAEHANTTASTILINLKSWYDRVFTSVQKEMLADTIWCNDKRTVSDTTYDPWEYGSIVGNGINANKTYYQANRRLNPISEAAPSLKCGNNASDNKISKFTGSDTTNGNGALNGYKIGLLTADEVAFAGDILYRVDNKFNYLVKNANDWYWTMSPSVFYGPGTTVCIVISTGRLVSGGTNHDQGLRPAVSLTSTVSIASGGVGTQEHPFVIVES